MPAQQHDSSCVPGRTCGAHPLRNPPTSHSNGSSRDARSILLPRWLQEASYPPQPSGSGLSRLSSSGPSQSRRRRPAGALSVVPVHDCTSDSNDPAILPTIPETENVAARHCRNIEKLCPAANRCSPKYPMNSIRKCRPRVSNRGRPPHKTRLAEVLDEVIKAAFIQDFVELVAEDVFGCYRNNLRGDPRFLLLLPRTSPHSHHDPIRRVLTAQICGLMSHDNTTAVKSHFSTGCYGPQGPGSGIELAAIEQLAAMLQ